MPEYRRNRIPGATYFTVNLLDRRSDLLVTHIDTLREAVRKTRRHKPFHIDAWTVLPDHMHCLWTLPEADSDFPGRWRAIKIAFSKSVPTTRTDRLSRSAEASAAFGNDVIGSTRSAMTAIMPPTWITSTSTR